MEIYDSRYFVINKRLQQTFGVWPYQSRVKNYFICGTLFCLMLAMLIPQLIRVKKYKEMNMDKTMENVFTLVYIFGIYIKLITAVIAEDKMKILYESTAKNFLTYTDEIEREILHEYSERGRFLTVGFVVYMIMTGSFYVMMPMIPVLMDIISPLNYTRDRMFIFNGDFLVDENDYYFEIWAFDGLACALTISIMCSTDPMYAAIVEHCLGLFSIVKFRLKNYNNPDATKTVDRIYPEIHGDEQAYAAIIRTIQLHNDILKYTQIIQRSYSLYFLFEIGVTIAIITSTSVILTTKINQMLDFIRYIIVLIALLMHMFFLTWPGQKLIDSSGDIFQDTYFTAWYENSLRCQNLLKIMSLGCLKPCELSGAGLYVLNFANFATIMKTSASYITVFSSF